MWACDTGLFVSWLHALEPGPTLAFPNVIPYSPFSLLEPRTGVQPSLLARLALPEGKLGSCPGNLIYEALKGTSDQKYLPRWPATSTRDPRLQVPH